MSQGPAVTTVSLFLRRSKDDSLVEKISGEFEGPDFPLLRQYVASVKRVKGSALVKRGMPTITNMKADHEGMKFKGAPYEDSELFELLHVLRPVILQEEDASFHKTSGLLNRRFKSRAFSDFLRVTRVAFEHGELSLFMQISVNQNPIFHENLIKLWLNGEQYHTDKEKEAVWKNIERSLGKENARALVMEQLQSKVKALLHLESVVGAVLYKSGLQNLPPLSQRPTRSP